MSSGNLRMVQRWKDKLAIMTNGKQLLALMAFSIRRIRMAMGYRRT